MNYLRLDRDLHQSFKVLVNRSHHYLQNDRNDEVFINGDDYFLYPLKTMLILYIKYGITMTAVGKRHSDFIYNGLFQILKAECDTLEDEGFIIRDRNMNGWPKPTSLHGKDGIFNYDDYYHWTPDILKVSKRSRIQPYANWKIKFPSMDTYLMWTDYNDDLLNTMRRFELSQMKRDNQGNRSRVSFQLPFITAVEEEPSVYTAMDFIDLIRKMSPAKLEVTDDKFSLGLIGYDGCRDQEEDDYYTSKDLN